MPDTATRFEFVVPGRPRGKPTVRATIRGKHAATYASKDQRELEARILACFREQNPGAAPIEGPVRLTIRSFKALQKARQSKSRPVTERAWDTAKPDGSNIQKAIEDALNGVAWLDDSQVVEWRGRKLRGSQGDPARTEVLIEELPA